MIKSALLRAAALLAVFGCQPGQTAHISGQLVESHRAALGTSGTAAVADRRITHVMAVDPESASPRRVLAAVGTNGHFSLDVNFGHPYVLVFVDASARGTDMVVATFRARTLDTLAPLAEGDIALGEVTAKDGVATASVPYDRLLQQMGLSAAGAEVLGAIDDLSLRYANPDIDGDGTIDVLQDHQFQLDFHLRAQMLSGDDRRPLRISDLTDQFLATSGPAAAVPDFNLGSIYAIYPAAFDGASYVGGGPPGAGLQNGAAFAATYADGSTAPAPGSFSPLHYGDRAGWGPDYNWSASPSLEMPGSAGQPVTLAFTLGASGHTLTFPNVLTRTHASLASYNTPVPFLRLETSGGHITGVEYRWMKRAADGAWLPCTAEELDLVVGDAGAFVGFSRGGSKENRVELTLGRQPAGNVPWTSSPTAPADICAMALSYDDKLGLRLFVGGVEASEGTPTCY
jgi:hypothetical protein